MTLRELERWSIVEYTMGLLAFCLPALRGWFVRLIGSKQGSTGRSGDQFADATIGSGPSSALRGLDAAKKKEAVWEDYSNVGDRMWDGASEEAICAMARKQTPRTMENGGEDWEMMVMGTSGNGGEIQRLNSMEPAHRGV